MLTLMLKKLAKAKWAKTSKNAKLNSKKLTRNNLVI